MEHFYESIEGWFDFADLYREAVRRMPAVDARMVEVGVYKGRSLFFLAVEAFNSGKPIHVYAVDKFDQPGAGPQAFSRLRAAHGLTQIVSMIEAPSVQAAKSFEDASVDFVFIDADHTYESVRADIAAWWPKVKPGGILAGHDFAKEFPGVEQAVIERFPSGVIEHEPGIVSLTTGFQQWHPRSWWVDKP